MLTLSLYFLLLDVLLRLFKQFFPLRLVISLRQRLILPNYLNLIGFLVSNLFEHFFCFFLPQHIIFNNFHQLLFLFLVNIRSMLVMDHITVLSPSHSSQFTGLQKCLIPLFCLFCDLTHSFMSCSFVVRL